MAVIELNNPSSLKVRLDLGMVDGKLKTKNKSYSYLKPAALTQDVYDIGTAMMSLQDHAVLDIIKQDNTVISL